VFRAEIEGEISAGAYFGIISNHLYYSYDFINIFRDLRIIPVRYASKGKIINPIDPFDG